MFGCWPYDGVYDGQDSRSVEDMAQAAIDSIERMDTNEDFEGDDHMIDDIANIANQAIFIWSGTEDDVVDRKGQEAMKLVYEHFGVDEKLTWHQCEGCGHGWEDDDFSEGTQF